MSKNTEYKVFCLNDFNDNECRFYKNNIYKLEKTLYKTLNDHYREVFMILITDSNGNLCQCHSSSKFYNETILKNFVELKEYRKLKLQKIYQSS